MMPVIIGISLLLVAIVTVTTICVVKRKKAKKELEAPDSVKAIGKGGTHRLERNKSAPNVIYEFYGKRTAVICPFCDAENDAHTANCAICGEKLS